MAKKKPGQPKTRPKSDPSAQRLPSGRKRAVMLVVFGLLAAVVASYLARDPIGAFFTSLIRSLGLGVAPVALWLVVFIWTLAKRRAWFRYLNLWAGSVALLFLVLGTMGFFKPGQGAVATFTLDGEVSLGGMVGEAIAGPIAWLGVLRLLGIFIAGLWATSPALATEAASIIWKLAVSTLLGSAMAARWIARAIPRRRKPQDQKPETLSGDAEPGLLAVEPPPQGGMAHSVVTSMPPSDASSGLPSPSTPLMLEEDDDEDDGDAEPGPVAVSPTPRLASIEDEEDDEDPDETPETYAGQPEPTRPLNGKFNSLWVASRADSAASPETDDAGDELPDADGDDEGPVQAQEWARPPIDILQNLPEGGVSDEDLRATAETIKRTLAEYNVEVEIGQVRPGPTVTMYGLIPGWVRRYKEVKEMDKLGQPKLDASGKPIVSRVETKTRVKVDTILAREKDLALALKTPSIRIQTPVMGESMVGIEVPNRRSSVVSLRAAMESPEFQRLRAKAHLPIALGRGSGGEAVVIDLTKMPHLLVAGATGSGKSVCLNAIVSCLIMEKTPAELRLLLIDPKRVELTPYNGIPHLLTPVVVETDKVVGVLKGMINEMLDRYRRMEQVGARNIEAYNRKSPVRMPYLVAAVDELADLMMTAAFEVEQSLCRLAQLGRATGIHLIVATQRPSVDVVTGLIKANFPSRISFAVSSQVDSRTILDTAGAERLLGRGDMLYLPLDASMPMRVQGVYISDRETENLISFWQTTPRAPAARIRIRAVAEDRGGYEGDEDDGEGESADKLLEKAVELAKTHSKLSTSLLQRRLRIGYPRAARLMDQLEERGIVGPSDGSKSRDVIINKM